jgi:hypothetical protein
VRKNPIFGKEENFFKKKFGKKSDNTLIPQQKKNWLNISPFR